MAPDSMPDMSISTAAVSGTITLHQPTQFADQSQFRLMALPKELRNKIYEFVFCDNITHVHELITYQRKREDDELVSTPSMTLEQTGVEAIFAYVPRPVPLDQTTPPIKESILPCRQLHSEMRKMQVAAYRAYWLKNRFVYTGTTGTTLPADKDMTRIEGFLIVLGGELNLHIRLQLAWVDFLAALAPTEQDAQRRRSRIVVRRANVPKRQRGRLCLVDDGLLASFEGASQRRRADAGFVDDGTEAGRCCRRG